jgi:hypothetical protein
MDWARSLAFITAAVDRELQLWNEYRQWRERLGGRLR